MRAHDFVIAAAPVSSITGLLPFLPLLVQKKHKTKTKQNNNKETNASNVKKLNFNFSYYNCYICYYRRWYKCYNYLYLRICTLL